MAFFSQLSGKKKIAELVEKGMRNVPGTFNTNLSSTNSCPCCEGTPPEQVNA